jgi:DNA-binding transcriptional MerR regulator
MKPMTIGQLAKQAQVGVETIRFYEREGLLIKAKRRPSGYREFTSEVVDRIRFINVTKQLGFSLREIRELLFLRIDGRATPKDLKKRINAKVLEIDKRLIDLKRLRRSLDKLSKACTDRGPIRDCALLDILGTM